MPYITKYAPPISEQAAFESLANAIIIQAVDDYRAALSLKVKPRRTIMHIERFFRGDWFRALTTVDGETLIRRLREEADAEEKRREKLFAPTR